MPSPASQSQIPNLNTLRRGRGSARPSTTASAASPGKNEEGEWRDNEGDNDREKKKDGIIQATDQDASVSRLSAVEVGYLEDPFAELFVPSSQGQGQQGQGQGQGQQGLGRGRRRRFPIINRGTYIRTRAIDHLVTLFLASRPAVRKQIISLGAGSDTRFFRIATTLPVVSELVYHELDFPAVTEPKISTITRSPRLTALVPGPVSLSSTSLHSPAYHIHPIDLRTLAAAASTSPHDPHHASPRTTQLPHVEPSLPTLIISECCLVYLAPHAADAVAAYLTHTLFPPSTPLGMILYEPIRPHDAFGQVMVANLAARGIALQTLRQYGSLAAQRERMAKYGFGGGSGGSSEVHAAATGGIGVADVNHLWETGVPAEEKARVAGLEMVDELEEWELLAAHYCVVWAWRDGEPAANDKNDEGNRASSGGGGDEDIAGVKGTGNVKGVWEGWRDVVGQKD